MNKYKNNLSKISGEDLVNNEELNAVEDAETGQTAIIPYPKRVFFIIGNEFCERFNYFGMKGTLNICNMTFFHCVNMLKIEFSIHLQQFWCST